MSPLAEVLHGEGLIITGSDMKESPAVDHLRSLGIPVVIGHRGESVEGKDLVIRTAAVHDDNPEIAAAHAAGHPGVRAGPGLGIHHAAVSECPVHLGHPRQNHPPPPCVPTSAMAARTGPHGDDWRYPARSWAPATGWGKGETIILESCEYCNSFLSFYPHRGGDPEH